jgi:hypothetical protein
MKYKARCLLLKADFMAFNLSVYSLAHSASSSGERIICSGSDDEERMNGISY